jgi:hypothetical protein
MDGLKKHEEEVKAKLARVNSRSPSFMALDLAELHSGKNSFISGSYVGADSLMLKLFW